MIAFAGNAMREIEARELNIKRNECAACVLFGPTNNDGLGFRVVSAIIRLHRLTYLAFLFIRIIPPPPLSPDPDLHCLPTSHTSFRLASTLLLLTLDSSHFILSRYYHLLSRIVYPFFTSFRLISYGSRFSFDYCRHVSSNFLPFKIRPNESV